MREQIEHTEHRHTADDRDRRVREAAERMHGERRSNRPASTSAGERSTSASAGAEGRPRA